MTGRHAPGVQRLVMVSLHTSPLLTPGSGDAGGMNVYVAQVADRLARRGVGVDVVTRATSPATAGQVVQLPGGARVHHLVAGEVGPVDKHDLPAVVDQFGAALADLLTDPEGPVDVVHSHYWLSGLAALTATRAGTSGPRPALVHTMHTMARVKNAALAPGDSPEPHEREVGEAAVVAGVDALVANTADEGQALQVLYGAAPARVHVVHPGVDLEVFTPQPQDQARRHLGLSPDAVVLLFVGRLQPLKAPEVLIRAAGELVRRRPELRDRLVLAVLGGLSGSGLAAPDAVAEVVRAEGLEDVLHRETTLPRADLARWYAAADLLVVPSRNESFGLVAVEAMACGTPVVAARVGGLPTAVGEVGVLVDGHDPADWADAIDASLTQLRAEGRRDWAARATAHAGTFGWERTVDGLLATYERARAEKERA